MANMATSKPTQKVTFGALAGAITTVLIWILKTYANTPVPGEVGAAITTVLTFLVAYIVPPSKDDQVVS